jgi:2-keto-4-pentenoate hydratase/2-oxohepta-3-ene-1,7-dioic acid hydratase in catechol pathway
MRLLRFGPQGHEKPGMLDADGTIRDLSAHIHDITPETLLPECLKSLSTLDPSTLPIVEAPRRIGAPITSVPNIIGIGLNYADHARETKGEPPPEPILFFKHTGSLCGPNDDIIFPPNARRLDWEAELAVVIGSPAHRITEDEAMDHVAGYMICNDVSERDAQFKRQGQWAKGKSAPTFCPVGPYLVTRDEVPDPQDLSINLTVNTEPMQVSSTQEMIFSVKYLVAYLSQFLRLMPGDIIATGTPAGVGLGRKLFLKPGDVIETTITGLGQQTNTVTE